MQRYLDVRRRLYFLILATALVLLIYWNILDHPQPSLEYDVGNIAGISLLESKWYYSIILLVCLLPVIAISITGRKPFIRKWLLAIASAMITSIFFLPWDILFSRISIWGFNDKYLIGIEILDLPLEEWLFFLVVPFCCIMIYEKVSTSERPQIPYRSVNMYTSFTIAICILILVTYPTQWYTASVAILGMCLASGLRATVPKYRLLDYYHAFFWCLIPFLLIDGMLTGLITSEPVVLYNRGEITGHRIFSIPVEDMIYCYGLLMINFVVYRRLRRD